VPTGSFSPRLLPRRTEAHPLIFPPSSHLSKPDTGSFIGEQRIVSPSLLFSFDMLRDCVKSCGSESQIKGKSELLVLDIPDE